MDRDEDAPAWEPPGKTWTPLHEPRRSRRDMPVAEDDDTQIAFTVRDKKLLMQTNKAVFGYTDEMGITKEIGLSRKMNIAIVQNTWIIRLLVAVLLFVFFGALHIPMPAGVADFIKAIIH